MQHLSVPTDKGANAGLKVASLVAGMVAGADSIDDMALLRHGGMGRVFAHAYAPSTLGSFLRAFTFGHVRQLDAVASRFLTGLADRAPLIGASSADRWAGAGRHRRHHHRGPRLRQAGLGLRLLRGPRTERAARHRHHRRVRAGDRGPAAAEGIVRFTARREAAGRRRAEDRRPAARPPASRQAAGAGRLRVLRPRRGRLPRSAAGADVSVTVRLDPKVKAAIATIGDDAWTPIEYTDAVFDEQTQHLGLARRGRRDRLHRVHLQEEGRAGPRAAGGPPDPRPQPRGEPRPGDAVRHLAVPRLLHHHRPRAWPTPWPRTRPTAATRSSSRSTPT